MVTIKEVTTKKELRKYLNFPNDLYRGNPYFVPSTYADDMVDWDRNKNPAFENAEGKCFLAYRDGQVVGRIGAIYNKTANKKWQRNRTRFTQVDFIDDAEVADALFAAVEDYARARGSEAVQGPLGFTDLDREGMLIKGFDRRSLFFTYYNHPYYIEHLERLGYTKCIDWIEYLISLPETPVDKLDRLADKVMRVYNLHVGECRTRKQIRQYVTAAFDLLNTAYAHLFGTVSLTDAQMKWYANKFLPLVDPRFVRFVFNEEEEMVAFGVATRSLAEAFRKCDGKLLPFGFIHVLKAMKGRNDTLDLLLVAVRPDLQGKGVNAIVMNELLKSAIANGVRYAETGPELETNDKVQAQWRFFETDQHKTRRCFEKIL